MTKLFLIFILSILPPQTFARIDFKKALGYSCVTCHEGTSYSFDNVGNPKYKKAKDMVQKYKNKECADCHSAEAKTSGRD